jgi:hypothetical protein
MLLGWSRVGISIIVYSWRHGADWLITRFAWKSAPTHFLLHCLVQ